MTAIRRAIRFLYRGEVILIVLIISCLVGGVILSEHYQKKSAPCVEACARIYHTDGFLDNTTCICMKAISLEEVNAE